MQETGWTSPCVYSTQIKEPSLLPGSSPVKISWGIFHSRKAWSRLWPLSSPHLTFIFLPLPHLPHSQEPNNQSPVGPWCWNLYRDHRNNIMANANVYFLTPGEILNCFTMLYLRHEICLWSYFHPEKKQTDVGLLYSTGTSTQYPVMAFAEKEFKKKSGYMCMYNFAIYLKLRQHCIVIHQ